MIQIGLNMPEQARVAEQASAADEFLNSHARLIDDVHPSYRIVRLGQRIRGF
jgi:hypothetical protein